MTDSPSALAGFISSDFGDVDSKSYTDRIGMNYVKCKVVGNTAGVYIPVQEGKKVYLATAEEIKMALGLDQVKNPIPAGYIKMYEGKNEQILPVNFNSHFLIGPEGAHLNISGISGLGIKDLVCDVFDESHSRHGHERKERICSFHHDECQRHGFT